MADIKLGALKPFVDEQIAEGRFADESEAVQTSLALLAANDRETDKTIEDHGIDAFRDLVRDGIEARDRGDFVSISSQDDADRLADDIRERGLERLARRHTP